MVEQWTHKPLDVGSNPTLATFCLKYQEYWMWVYWKTRPVLRKSHPRHFHTK